MFTAFVDLSSFGTMTIIREQLPLWEDPEQIILFDKEKVDIST